LEIRADKMPIGYSRNLQAFKNHVVKLEKNDIVYIFSDGFTDQTGGDSGRKYMVKNFRKLIIDISENPMSEQRQLMLDELTRWQGDKYSQMDDILVFGLRFDNLKMK
jgi:serine phosphatase RsbU (regulator of sigma subunit)